MNPAQNYSSRREMISLKNFSRRCGYSRRSTGTDDTDQLSASIRVIRVHPRPKKTRLADYPGFLLAALLFATPAGAGETVEGFTEPYRTIQVASAETGLLHSLFVRVGDPVLAGQQVASLDDDIQVGSPGTELEFAL